jgi:hypothetical protein
MITRLSAQIIKELLSLLRPSQAPMPQRAA